MELALTGRHALPSVLELADLVTEMGMVKHYYYQGVKAREGIDF
jgi:cob(I)alamin adenosyltransferase